MIGRGGGLVTLLRYRDFPNLFVAGVLTSFARWAEILFVGVYVFSVSGSPFLTAIVAMLRFLPLALFGVLVGALAEQFGPRRLLLALTALSGIAAAAQCLLAAFGSLSVWHLFIGALVSGLHWSAEMSTRRTMIGHAVGADEIAGAFALDVGANNASRMVGPFFGGLMLVGANIEFAFLIVALMHLASFVAVHNCRNVHPAMGASMKLFVLIGEVLRLARSDRVFIGILLVTMIFNVFAFPVLSMIPVIGERSLGLSPLGIGILSSAEGAGAFLGATLIGRFRVGRYRWHLLYWGGTAVAMAMAMAFVHSPTYHLAFLALLAMGVGAGGFSVMQSVLAISCAEKQYRSRYMGLITLAIGIGPLGFFMLGWLADWIGPQVAVTIMSVVGMLTLGISIAFYPEIVRGRATGQFSS